MKGAEILIIGGGVHGCSIAYHLASKGWKRILLLEKHYLGSGATGRSGAGFRHQFGTEINIKLALASIRRLERLARELDYTRGIDFTRSGYLFLAYNHKQLKKFRDNARLQKKIDPANQTVILDLEGVKELVPQINPEGLVGGSFNPEDGHVCPFHVTQAFALAASRKGVDIQTGTGVKGIKKLKGGIFEVATNSGESIRVPRVVLAAGAYSRKLGQDVGLGIPVYPKRKQKLVTEAYKPFLDPMVISLAHETSFKQTPQGNFLMSANEPEEVRDFNHDSSWKFLVDAARKMTFHMSVLARARVIRQWAGLYDVTPDSQGIVGETLVKGIFLDLGWSGHGFQLAPAVGQIMAEIISGEEPFINVSPLSLARFERGELIPEPLCV